MSTFAPVYQPSEGQESFLRREARRKKRKISHDAAESSSDDSVLPISRSDPYYIAGWSHEREPPSRPFPFAAVKVKTDEVNLEQELLELNPPVHKITNNSDDLNIITNRQHIDNLTTLLHRCVNNGDWKRASRILGLLLRSEYNGAIDLRQHDRWAIAAEVLMRRDNDSSVEDISDAGLKAARQYYERMILQYPHTVRSSDSFNASKMYPSLFNIWIFEVQQRSKTKLKSRSASPLSSNSSLDDEEKEVRQQEANDAEQIAARLDQLLVSPPYDTNRQLLRLRAMVALWLADLYDMLSGRENNSRSQQARALSKDIQHRLDDSKD